MQLGDFAGLRWNTKCVIQSIFLLVCVAMANHRTPPMPLVVGFNWETIWKFTVLAVVFYGLNAMLDMMFSCDHGTLYEKIGVYLKLPYANKPQEGGPVPVPNGTVPLF